MSSALGGSNQLRCPRSGMGRAGQPVIVVRPTASFLPPPPGRNSSPTNWTAALGNTCQRLEIATTAVATRGPGNASTSTSTTASATGSHSDTGGTGAGGGLSAVKRRRLVLQRELPTINWHRFELGVYGRLDELEKALAEKADAAEAEGGGAEPAGGSSWFAERVANSDLTAAYFRRWDDPTVHQPLLQDRVLTGAWRDALSAAPPGALDGKTVLDLGCGVGLLSMMVAKAGAARVIAVDGSEGAVEAARRIVKANNLADKITVVHGAIEDLSELPDGVQPGQVDVIVSNWMGSGLLAGGMANSLAHAVKTWLRPGGLVLPDKVSLWTAALEDRDALQEAKDAWSRVAGLDLSAALATVIRHPRRDILTRRSQLLSAPQRLAEWRTVELRPETLVDPATGAYATCPVKLTAVRDERLFGLVLYWEAQWTFGGALEGEDKSPVRFTTHPLASSTHYQQLMMDFPRSVRVAADDEITGELVLRPGSTDPRDLELELEVTAGPPGTEAVAGAPISASYRISHLG